VRGSVHQSGNLGFDVFHFGAASFHRSGRLLDQ
jgi:hypothetical protein